MPPKRPKSALEMLQSARKRAKEDGIANRARKMVVLGQQEILDEDGKPIADQPDDSLRLGKRRMGSLERRFFVGDASVPGRASGPPEVSESKKRFSKAGSSRLEKRPTTILDRRSSGAPSLTSLTSGKRRKIEADGSKLVQQRASNQTQRAPAGSSETALQIELTDSEEEANQIEEESEKKPPLLSDLFRKEAGGRISALAEICCLEDEDEISPTLKSRTKRALLNWFDKEGSSSKEVTLENSPSSICTIGAAFFALFYDDADRFLLNLVESVAEREVLWRQEQRGSSSSISLAKKVVQQNDFRDFLRVYEECFCAGGLCNPTDVQNDHLVRRSTAAQVIREIKTSWGASGAERRGKLLGDGSESASDKLATLLIKRKQEDDEKEKGFKDRTKVTAEEWKAVTFTGGMEVNSKCPKCGKGAFRSFGRFANFKMAKDYTIWQCIEGCGDTSRVDQA